MLRYLRMGDKRIKTVWWVLIIVTVVTFLGGFVFLFGAGFNSTTRAQLTGAIGTVNGAQIRREDYESTLTDQRAQYERQYGTSQPTEADQRVVEVQAWRSIVTQLLLNQQAKAAGLEAHDREVLLTLQSNPPALLTSSPAFQTDGKFDPNKYRAALSNPNNNWGSIEDVVRRQIPMRKLQERLISSLKLSEGEVREAWRNQNERVDATVLQVPASSTAKIPAPTDADLQRTYDEYKSRFVSGPRTVLEVLEVTKRYGQEELRQARETASTIMQRARGGEDFAQLAKDYSEGPGADQGGVVPQVITPQQFGPELGPKLLGMSVGEISEPLQDAGRFIVFKIIERVPGPNNSVLGLRVAQIVINTKPAQSALDEQRAELEKVRARATRIGLGRAASEKGVSTRKTEPFDFNNPPQSIFTVPQASEWGLSAKVGAVSPLFEGADQYLIAQVDQQKAPGPTPRKDLTEPLRNIAELAARVGASKPRADSVQAMIQAGRSLEDIGRALSLATYRVTGATRARPDPRLSAAEDLSGALFAARPGQTIGPFRALNGWYFARVESKMEPAAALYDSSRNELQSQIMQNRQRTFMSGYMADLYIHAKVTDLRGDTR